MISSKKIRVCLITYPSVIGARVINTLLNDPQIELVGIVLESSYMGELSSLPRGFSFLKKTGLPYSAHKMMLTQVGWQLLKMRGFLKHYQGEIKSTKTLKAPAIIEWLKTLNCDYICSAYSLLLFNEAVIAIPKKRAIVMHHSILPYYAGPEPMMRMISHNDYEHAGATIFLPSKILDSGNMLYQEKIQTPPITTLSNLDFSLWRQGRHILARWLVEDFNHPEKFPEKIMDHNELAYHAFPSASEVNMFRLHHGHLFDFKNYMKEIHEVIKEYEAISHPK